MSARIITPDFSQSQGSFLDNPGAYNLCRGLRVTYTDKLKAYLENQRDKDILISAYKPHGHMGKAEENIQQITEALADKLINNGTPYVVGEMGRVLISNTWIPDERDAVVELDLTSWLGVKAVTARGLKRQDVLGHFSVLMQAIDKED
ncbi:MAG: hypothetical protein IJ113_02095 [Eggerthellaceae bacterium]|nr:hypothetical protein [Eggerthellaceae bacterium]